MLRRENEGYQSSFGDLARAARSVPQDHVLLRMKAVADWAAVEQKLAGYYDPREGRPSWPPAVMVRMLILEHYADLSDREASEQVAYNLLYRSFVGLGVDEAVPDDTTLVRFRTRLGEAGVREVFDLLNRQWERAGLIGTERRVVDGSHLWGKVARRSWVSLMREGRTLVVEALTAVDEKRGQDLRERYVPPPEQREPRGEEALGEERERTRELLEAVKDVEDERVRERSRLLEAMLGQGDWPVSFVDPDARWGHKAEDKPFCGYKTHEGIDPDSRMVTAVEVMPGNANEAVRTGELLRRDSVGVASGAVIIGDGLYNNATTVGQVQGAGGRACFSGLKAERVSDGFEYDAAADQMICAQSKHSIGKVRVDAGDLYYFSMGDCQGCPRKEQCLTPGEREGKARARRRVYLSDVRKAKILAGQAGREWRRRHLKVRGRIEAKFDEQMNRHGLRRARYWGLPKVTVQVLLNVITVNLKRAEKLLKARAAPTPVAALVPA
jgi:IS5 family transposase